MQGLALSPHLTARRFQCPVPEWVSSGCSQLAPAPRKPLKDVILDGWMVCGDQLAHQRKLVCILYRPQKMWKTIEAHQDFFIISHRKHSLRIYWMDCHEIWDRHLCTSSRLSFLRSSNNQTDNKILVGRQGMDRWTEKWRDQQSISFSPAWSSMVAQHSSFQDNPIGSCLCQTRSINPREK